MAKLKVKDIKVKREFLNTQFPDRNYTLKTVYHLVWVQTSKGWYYLNTKFINPAHAAQMELKIKQVGKVDLKHWSTFL
jgi:hypothetical protein